MGSKLDALRKNAGELGASLGSGRAPGVPLGMDAPVALSPRVQGLARDKRLNRIPVDRIVPDPDQPRKEFDPDAIARLGESLKARGQLQPCTAYWDEGQGAYILLVGERRWRAASHAGLPDLLCIVLDGRPDDRERLALQVVENLLREDLAPVEQARAYRELMDLNGWGTNQLARELHIPASAVSQALALLELPAPIQERVDAGEVAASVGYELSKLDDRAAQVALADRVVAERLTRDEAVAEVRRLREDSGSPPKGRASKAAGKGRGGARKLARWEHRRDGVKLVVERPRGLDGTAILAALEAALDAARAQFAAPGRDAA